MRFLFVNCIFCRLKCSESDCQCHSIICLQWCSNGWSGPLCKDSKSPLRPPPLPHTGSSAPYGDRPACSARLAHPIAKKYRYFALLLLRQYATGRGSQHRCFPRVTYSVVKNGYPVRCGG